jgi:endoglucanase
MGTLMIACPPLEPVAAGEAARTSIDQSRPLEAPASPPQMATREIISEVSRAWFKSEWRAYRSAFVTPEGRVVDNGSGGVSHSEGQGYGLLLAAFAEDRDAFQLIWSWTEKNLRARPDALLAWRWDPKKGQIADMNNATDGDILVAWALAEGGRRFARPDYFEPAKQIAQAIGAKMIQRTDRGPILLPGSSGFSREDQPDGPLINLSYWVFPAFSTLKEFAPEYDWDGLRASGLNLLNESRFGPRRLPADWQSVATRTMAPAKNFPAEFGYNAIRIPLYLAWSDDEAARHALRRFAGLWRGPDGAGVSIVDVNSGAAGPALDGAGYRLVAALARCSAFGQPVDSDLIRSRDALYYPDTLRMLSLAVIQQRFPQCL